MKATLLVDIRFSLGRLRVFVPVFFAATAIDIEIRKKPIQLGVARELDVQAFIVRGFVVEEYFSVQAA
jgi:hypothetical protein